MAKNINLNTYFYFKSEIDNFLSNKANKNLGSNNARKNVVTDANGNITTEEKPHIPENVSELNNDSGFLTQHQDISGKLDKAQGSNNANKNVVTNASGQIVTEAKPSIPTTTNDLVNNSGFITQSSLNNYVLKSSTAGLIRNDGSIDTNSYLTEHQDISDKVDRNELATVAITGSYNNLFNKPTIPDVSGKEDTSNKTTSVSSSSTNTQYPSAKAVYDAIQAIPSPEFIEITSNKGTASASTMDKFYVEITNNKRDVYYTEENGGSYSWHKLDTDILDDLSIDWEDIQNKPSTMTPTSHTHTKSQITDFPTSMTPTSHTDSNGAYGKATTSVWGHTKLNSATNSTSTTESATPSAVKAAYDLANGKASTSHTHGSISNTGTLNSDITSVNKIAVTDSSNNLKTISKLPADKVTHQDISGKANASDLNDLAEQIDDIVAGDLDLTTYAKKTDLATVATSGSYNDLSNKPNIPTKTSDLTNDSNFLTSHQNISGKEDTSNKVTSLSSSSTNIQYPSAKAVYDAIQAIPSPEFIEITSDKGTASASTMEKFYIEVSGDKRDVYYTEESNGSYSWHKLDIDVLDDLSIDWSDIQNKPTASTSQAGIVQLEDSYSSTSTTKAATPKAVKTAYDLANGKPSLGTTSTTAAKGDHNHDGTYIKTGTGTVTSTNIADKTIVNGDIADATITGGKLVDGIITNAKIGNNQVDNAKLSNNAVTTEKIVDGNVTKDKLNSDVKNELDNKLSKTGGVSQHSNGNIIIPSASDSTDNNATGKIPFAGHLVSSTYSIEDFTTKLKSFMGGLKDKDNHWWNVISARQTNGGGSDGEKQGLLLKTRLEATGDLIWNKEYLGNWGTERTILDSSNYSNYANKTTVENNLTSTSTTNALSANQGRLLNESANGKITRVLTTEDNLDDLTYGRYSANIPTIKSITNDVFTHACIIEVLTFGNTISLQIMYELGGVQNDNAVWYRVKYDTSGWLEWENLNLANKTEMINSTHTSSTSNWTGKSNHLNTLSAGTLIFYKLLQDPTTNDVTLNLTLKDGTTTGAKSVYITGNRLKNEYFKNSTIQMIYDGSKWIVLNTTYPIDNLTNSSSTHALSAKQGKILNDRYKGVTLASSGNNTAKPYYRLFNITSGSGSSKSSRLIFEISSKTSTAYGRFAVYIRQNTSTSASTVEIRCIEQGGLDLNSIFVGFRNNYPNTCCDIYIKVQSMVHYIIKIIDDQLREGTYTQYSPTEGNVEAYTSVADAGTQLYGSAYTNIINPTWNIVATSIKKSGGTSSQFLKADGSVDENTYSLSEHTHGNIASDGSVEIVKSTQSSATNVWTGTSSKISSLVAGTRIFYYLQKNSNTSNVTLNLTLSDGTATGAKSVAFGQSGTYVTNQFKAYTMIELVYDGTYWYVVNPYNVSNSLTDTSTNIPLSAGQGKVLKDLVDGKAPTSHASTATTYGASSASNYGHAMASSTTPKANGTAAVGSETTKFARGDHVHPIPAVSTAKTLTFINTVAFSGTVQWVEKNGWAIIYYENLKCDTTQTGFTACCNLPKNTAVLVYDDLDTITTATGMYTRVNPSTGRFEIRCLNANTNRSGHIVYPLA